jgi:acetyl-CoA acyltransferase
VSGVRIAGTGMTRFGRMPGRGIRALAMAAITEAMSDAGLPWGAVERIFVGNAAAGVVSRQEMIRGQVIVRGSGLAGVPLINVENACASGSTATHLAWQTVQAGLAEVVLVVGVEQMTADERWRTFEALCGSTDVEETEPVVAGDLPPRSILMDFYAAEAQAYLDGTGATREDFARVAVKNRSHAAHNPLAQYQGPQTLEEVLAAREIIPPLSLPMCSPTTDGAAALLVVSDAVARRLDVAAPEFLASVLTAGRGDGSSPLASAAAGAYAAAGLGPDDLDVVELHDAAAPAELLQYADVGLCAEGEGHQLVRDGVTALGGRLPVNTSGGLLSRGHALGATGCAQIVEIVEQLRDRAGGRQVPDARIGMAVNAGGWLDGSYAVGATTILRAAD